MSRQRRALLIAAGITGYTVVTVGSMIAGMFLMSPLLLGICAALMVAEFFFYIYSLEVL